LGAVIDTTLFGLFHDYFKIYLPKQRRCSEHTFRSYRSTVDSFIDFVKDEHGINLTGVTFKMLNSDMLSKFLDKIEDSGCGISTRNHRLNCIRAFFTYAAKSDPTTIIYKADIYKVPLKKPSEPIVVKHMSEKAITALLDEPDPFTKKGMRDRFIMLLMYDTAARVQELIDFRLCDIKLGKTPVIAVQKGKGDKFREIPLMKKTVEHLQNYIQAYHPDADLYSEVPLFYTGRKGIQNPADSSTIRKLIISYAKSAREHCKEVPEHVTPHMIRHSRAMHLYQRGMDLTLVSQWVGHSRLDTTLVYAYYTTNSK